MSQDTSSAPPAKPKFGYSDEELATLPTVYAPGLFAGRRVLVSGAGSGIGKGIAFLMARLGARLIICGRKPEALEETATWLRKLGSPEVLVVPASIRDPDAVASLMDTVWERFGGLDVLINNAGGQFKTMTKTSDGIETTFALNTLGAWTLERELHGAIAAAKGRVVNVATGFLDSFPVDVDDLVAPKKYKSIAQYGRTKQASVMMTVEQAKRYESEGVKAVSIHPGIIMGTRFNGGQPKAMQMIAGPIMRAIGIACTLDEAQRRFRVAAFGDVPNGSYLVNGAPAPLPKQVNDGAVRTRVVQLLEKLSPTA